jgi:hypothetical protein
MSLCVFEVIKSRNFFNCRLAYELVFYNAIKQFKVHFIINIAFLLVENYLKFLKMIGKNNIIYSTGIFSNNFLKKWKP